MPQLGAEKADRVKKAESTGGVMEPGMYVMRLTEVKEFPGQESPYWRWTFTVPEDTEEEHAKKFKKWNQWHNTSLSEQSEWALNAVFEAFQVPTNTNTDDLIGRLIKVAVEAGTIQKGPKKGQPTTRVSGLYPLLEGDWGFDPKVNVSDGTEAAAKKLF